VKCAVTATATPASFSPQGGSGTLAVTTNRECQWSAAAASSWIQLGASTTGQGDATLAFTVGANSDPAIRRGGIAVGDQQVGITQDAASCAFTVEPGSDSVTAEGGRRTIAVTASSAQCTWTARSDADWLAIVEGAQGSGNGQVKYEARATSGPTRSGTLTVAGRAITITQGEGCTTAITPTSQSVAASGGTGTITLATSAGCAWTARSDAPWIAIASGQTGAGPGAVIFNVAPSDGPARTGTLTVDGHAFTVSQANGCRYTLDPASQSFADAGGSGVVNVHAAAGCAWTATSTAAWIGITSGQSGSGSGAVNFSVVANPMGGAARNGTIAVNDQTFAVAQAAGAACVYTLTPTSQDFSAGEGIGGFVVTTANTCPWSATANDAWITILGAGRGAGVGTVAFSVAANPGGGGRTGTIDVRGPLFTVNQAGSTTASATTARPR
jgi:hypothetical protein